MVESEAKPIRFGISLPNRAVLFVVSPALLIETAEAAEQSGFFDSAWVGDNLLSKPRLESIVTLSALAARTSRLKLGEVCLVAAHAWDVAGALRAGARAVFVARPGAVLDPLIDPPPELVVADLDELADRLA